MKKQYEVVLGIADELDGLGILSMSSTGSFLVVHDDTIETFAGAIWNTWMKSLTDDDDFDYSSDVRGSHFNNGDGAMVIAGERNHVAAVGVSYEQTDPNRYVLDEDIDEDYIREYDDMVYYRTPIGKDEDNDGESVTHYYKVGVAEHFPEIFDPKLFVYTVFPSTFCQHDHDCCGNWYSSIGEIIIIDWHRNEILVRQRSSINV